MKTLLSIFAVLLIFGCKSTDNVTPKENLQNLAKPAPSQTSQVMPLEFVTPAELEESVSYLASDALQGRATGSEGIEKAAVYIENKFKAYKVMPYFETYRDDYDARGKKAFNVVGYLEGNDPELKSEVIILGAHYDHIGFGKPVANDSIANGANDDATGTAAVLAMARYFATKRDTKRSVLFTLYSGEEMGLLGSKHLAETLKKQGLNVYTMINFEMIGVPMTDKGYDAYFTGYDLSNMATALNGYVGYDLLGLLPQAKEFQLFYRSDNYSFYKAFRKPCHAISTFDFTNYDYYHHVDDEADQMDYDFMARLVNKLLPALETMCNTATPEIKLHE